MFAADRDLLVVEPELFRDVGWAGQRLVKGVGDVSGTTLTLTSQDNTLAAAGIGAGNVVTVGDVAYEVVARLSATTATISRIRPDPSGAVIPPAPATGKAVVVPTFGAQIAWTHRQILRMLGIDPDETDDGLKETDITNPAAFRESEAMGALSLVLISAAGPAVDGGSGAAIRINRGLMYRERFAHMVRMVGARLDTDGDGVADATRRAGLVWLDRS